MLLQELAALFLQSNIRGDAATAVTGLAVDSRRVSRGDLFLCIPGFTQDGHDFAASAVEQGASALTVERLLPLPVPQLVVPNARYAASVIARHFYGDPSRTVRTIGVTGTNGKTTTSSLIEAILAGAGHVSGLMGTIHIKIGGATEAAERTTADAVSLQRTLRRMADAGAEYCVMEVSSHALDQGRTIGIDFRTAVFTNLTQDHLDYHGTMEKYAAVKGLFFSRLGNAAEPGERSRKFAVLNADDPAHQAYKEMTAAETITYGIDSAADVRASDIRLTARGTSMKVRTFAGETSFTVNMLGKFNVYNILGAVAATLAEGIPLHTITGALERLPGVEGRVERVDAGQSFTVLVDYAHTPDGLLNVLDTVNEFARARIITVFGCGGDRDRLKRPIMGRIAAERSDYTIVTSDNPRTEDPESITKEIEAGLVEAGASASKYEIIVDRLLAIQKAVEMAEPDDVVLIAGKGHETYQIIGGVTLPFDDRVVAREAILGGAKA
jgi:UDP-N-acetylmuramoyl-L-alanyl-D-glutamate--2,6-diaminopimelate ligase